MNENREWGVNDGQGWTYDDLVRNGDVLDDKDPIFIALREAARRGDTEAPPEIGSKKLTEKEEVVADAIRREAGLGPEVVRRETPNPVSLRLTPSTVRLLTEMAQDMGYWHGGKGSIRTLLEAVGSGKLVIVPYGTAI